MHDPARAPTLEVVWWTRGAVVFGLLLLLAGFAVGVAPRTVDDGGQEVRCGTVLLDAAAAESGFAVADSARAEREGLCADGTAVARRVTWGLVAAGALAALAGWTGVRENGRTRSAAVPVA